MDRKKTTNNKKKRGGKYDSCPSGRPAMKQKAACARTSCENRRRGSRLQIVPRRGEREEGMVKGLTVNEFRLPRRILGLQNKKGGLDGVLPTPPRSTRRR